MKGYNKWSYKPYIPLDRPKDKPYISRIAPQKNGFLMEYMLNGSGFLNVNGKRIPLTKSPINVDDLETGREYTIFIEDENGEKRIYRKILSLPKQARDSVSAREEITTYLT